VTAVIALRPKTDHGGEILDELERQTEVPPMQGELDDGARRYYLGGGEADVDSFDLTLTQIDTNWREHVENWRSSR
jgi:hypothetical protein